VFHTGNNWPREQKFLSGFGLKIQNRPLHDAELPQQSRIVEISPVAGSVIPESQGFRLCTQGFVPFEEVPMPTPQS
jgi:hypothetical protein